MSTYPFRTQFIACGLQVTTVIFLYTSAAVVWAADTDIYGPASSSLQAPNVLIHFDNTVNWSAQNNAWKPGSVYDKCKGADTGSKTPCKDAVSAVFKAYKSEHLKWPWESNFKEWESKDSPNQGQLQLKALKYALSTMVCDATTPQIAINVGISLFNHQKGSVSNKNDSVIVIHHAVQPLTRSPKDTCATLLAKLDRLAANILESDGKAHANANYAAVVYEAFKYFGGYTNPNLVATDIAGRPVSRDGYGTGRFGANKTPLDDPEAFIDDKHATYRPPTSHCNSSYLLLIGNSYPSEEPFNGPLRYRTMGYSPPTLSPTRSDTHRLADEWAHFAANTDINPAPGIQPLNTFAVNVFNTSPDARQIKLLKSIAAVGSPDNIYLEVGGDLLKLISAFESVFQRASAKESVFASAALPVSTHVQGTFLNQVYVGMFRPDANFRPRWVGNMRQYQMGFTHNALTLLDANSNPATFEGVFAATAKSFWTDNSVFFDSSPLGTPASHSDNPDGAIAEKGGAAQMLRQAHLHNAKMRKVYTLPAIPTQGVSLSSTPFDTAHSGLSAELVHWARGENNVSNEANELHPEHFNGSYLKGGIATSLGNTGARHSMHGDVLHSTPVALNYGGTDVVVFYGSNDGHFRAIDGRKSGSGAGSELWSFIPREHYNLIERLRRGTPPVQMPENNDLGELIAADEKQPRTYGMDGPIGSYVRYSGNTLTEAIIFPSMRRGGRTLYALDVTDKNNPKFKWKIAGGGAGDFAKLAQTWSMPRTIAVDGEATPNLLMVMGGGYDPAEDSNQSAGIGHAVFIINGRTGNLIKRLDTEFSVPSEITLVDTNRDGRPDRLYFADVRGNLYRIDVPTNGSLVSSSSWESVKATKIAELEGKVFYRPDVVVTQHFAAIMVGTGDREKPTTKVTNNRFFLIKDPLLKPIFKILRLDDLSKIAVVNNDTMAPEPVTGSLNENGCYIELATNGEKAINAPLTAAGVTYFGTHRPTPATHNACNADLGQGFSYRFPLFCKPPLAPTEILGGGMPPSPVGGVVLLEGKDKNGRPITYKQPFLIGGSGPSALDAIDPQPPTAPKRRPLFWRINNNP